MATLQITIPDNKVIFVQDNFALNRGFTGFDPLGEVENKAQFLKRKVTDFIKNSVNANEIQIALTTAKNTAVTDLSGIN